MYSGLSIQERQKADSMVIRAIKRRRPIRAKRDSDANTLEIVECLNNISEILRGCGFKELLKMFLYPDSRIKKYVLQELRCRMHGRR